jgi:hypothetical protein
MELVLNQNFQEIIAWIFLEMDGKLHCSLLCPETEDYEKPSLGRVLKRIFPLGAWVHDLKINKRNQLILIHMHTYQLHRQKYVCYVGRLKQKTYHCLQPFVYLDHDHLANLERRICCNAVGKLGAKLMFPFDRVLALSVRHQTPCINSTPTYTGGRPPSTLTQNIS